MQLSSSLTHLFMDGAVVSAAKKVLTCVIVYTITKATKNLVPSLAIIILINHYITQLVQMNTEYSTQQEVIIQLAITTIRLSLRLLKK